MSAALHFRSAAAATTATTQWYTCPHMLHPRHLPGKESIYCLKRDRDYSEGGSGVGAGDWGTPKYRLQMAGRPQLDLARVGIARIKTECICKTRRPPFREGPNE